MTLSVFKNEVVEHVVAESEADASQVWRETVGEDYDEEDCGAWEREPDDTVLSITDDSGENEESKTCAQWAASNGRGFLCSTEY